MTELQNLALKICTKSFEGKKDKAGQEYINHLVRVSNRFKNDEFLYIIALLHDILEDCPEWNEKSLTSLFGANIAITISKLTKKKNQNYFEYIESIKNSTWAKKVKLSDLEDNMDITRLPCLQESDFKRLQKYLKAYKILSE